MDTQMENQNPNINTTGGEEKSSSSSLVVGIIVVIVLAILGGLYFWGAQLEQEGTLEEGQNMPEVQLSPEGEPMVETEDMSAAVSASVDELPPLPEAPDATLELQ